MSKIRPNQDRGKRAVVWITIITCVSAVVALSSVYTYFMYGKIIDGSASYDEIITFGVAILAITAANFILYVLGIIFFIMWFRRAYYNLHQLTGGLTYSEGWAAGAWFVPLFHLFGPFQIAKELFAESNSLLGDAIKPEQQKNNRTDLGFWWGFWVVGNLIGNVANVIGRNDSDLHAQMNAAIVTAASATLLVIAGLFCVRIIKSYMIVERQLENLDHTNLEYKADNTDLLDTSI